MDAVQTLKPLPGCSLLIADIRPGLKGSQAEQLCGFLHVTRCDRLFLVGDIIGARHIRNGILDCNDGDRVES
jgi:hypothetical protein